MVAVLRDDDLREQARPDDTSLQERGRQGSDDRHGVRVGPTHVLGAHGAQPQETGGLIVEPFASLFRQFGATAVALPAQPAGR